jgi:hypothetical protein
MDGIETLSAADLVAPVELTTEYLSSIIYYYGFRHFMEKVLPMVDFNDVKVANAVDESTSRRYQDCEEMQRFTVPRAFEMALRDIMDDGFDREEAIEVLADEEYVVPVHIAMYYSVDAGDMDVERLSALLRNRAKRILRGREN